MSVDQEYVPKELTEEYIVAQLVDDPFSIEKPGFALHEIYELKKKLTEKLTNGTLTQQDKILWYRLRVADLLWIVNDCQGHIAWLEDAHKNLKAELGLPLE